jgi:2-dehydropantoate 2-reductase
MNAVIIGAGAVGSGIGSCLIEAGARVTFVTRAASQAFLAEHGLRRTGIFGELEFPPDRFSVVEKLDELPDEPVDYVLVCTKSFDSAAVADVLAPTAIWRHEACKIVLCQNGWGNFEIFAERLPPAKIFNARVITGFARKTPGHVDITVHADAIKVGSLSGEDVAQVAPLAERITQGGIPAEVTATIERDLWAKMLYNCCLNPLGAVLDASYGNLGDSAPTRSIMDEIARETFAVMQAGGYETHWQTADAFLTDFYGKMLPPTAAHHSSMLQDIRAGRRTEIGAMSGAVVALGEKHGVPTPLNATMERLIRFKEPQT